MKKSYIFFITLLLGASAATAQLSVENISLGVGYRQSGIEFGFLESTDWTIDNSYHQGLVFQAAVGLNFSETWLLEAGFNLNPGAVSFDAYSPDNDYKELSKSATFSQFFVSGLFKFKNGGAGLVLENSRFDKRFIFDEAVIRVEESEWRPGIKVRLEVNNWLELHMTACNQNFNVFSIENYSLSLVTGINIYNLLNK